MVVEQDRAEPLGAAKERPFERALVVRFGRIGDMLVVTPAVRALRQAAPGATIDLLTSAEGRLVFSPNPNVNRVHVLEWRRVPRSVNPERARLVRSLRQTGYDAVFLLEGAERFHALVHETGATPVFSFAREDEPADRLHARRSGHHELHNFLAVLDLAGIEPAGEGYDYPVSGESRERADALLAERGVDRGSPVVGLHAGHFEHTRFGRGPHAKTWPLERWIRLIRDLISSRPVLHVALTGGSSERTLNRAITAGVRSGRAVDLAGSTDLPVLAAVIARCEAFIAPDTGPAHLAAAVGTPLVALFGPKPPGIMGPLGDESRIERLYRGPSSASDAVRRGHHPRMWAITVDDVHAAIDRLGVGPTTRRS